MERKVIEEKVRNFLIEDLEIEEEKIAPEARLRMILVLIALTSLILLLSWRRTLVSKLSQRKCRGL